MRPSLRALCISAALLASSFTSAHATTVIDFESPALTGIYFDGDSFVSDGFRFTTVHDVGTIDQAGALGDAAPVGNNSQFYTQLNDGALWMSRDDGQLMNLESFDAAFVPLIPAGPANTVMIVDAFFDDGTASGIGWYFAAPVGNSSPFGTYNDANDFKGIAHAKFIRFRSCVFDGAGICATATDNNGQFAIDNIHVNAVPEPTTVLLLSAGLLGLALRRRAAR